MSPRNEYRPISPREALALSHRNQIPTELQQYVPAVERFIQDHNGMFQSITPGKRITFTPGLGFSFNLRTEVVTVGVEDWQWAEEHDLPEWGRAWSVCHELEHYHQWQQDPTAFLEMLAHIKQTAFDQSGDPRIQSYFQKKVMGLYNSIEDMFINGTLARRSPVFAAGPAADDVHRLYRDFLFPTNRGAQGVAPLDNEPVDYSDRSVSEQFVDVPLRAAMVPDQDIILSEEARTLLLSESPYNGQSYYDIIQTIVDSPQARRSPQWRLDMIRTHIEPMFIELVRRELAENPEQATQPPDEGSGNASPLQQNNWESMEAALNQIATAEAERNEAESSSEQSAAEPIRQTPHTEELLQQLHEQSIRDLARPEGLERSAEDYLSLRREVMPYIKEFGSFLFTLFKTQQHALHQREQRRQRRGSFHTRDFVRHYGIYADPQFDYLVDWDEIRTYEAKKPEEDLLLVPNDVILRLVLDNSGSMIEDRIQAVRKLYVLTMESTDIARRMARRLLPSLPLSIRSEVYRFGSDAEQVKPLDAATYPQEMTHRLRGLRALQPNAGGTYDAAAYALIDEKTDNATYIERLKKGEARDQIITVTDGGTSSEAESKRLIAKLLQRGVRTNGFLIGDVSPWEERIFTSVYGDRGARVEKLDTLIDQITPAFREAFVPMGIKRRIRKRGNR